MLTDDFSNKNENFERYKERLTNFSQEFELGLFLFIARKNIFWVLLFIAVALSAAFLYLRYTPPVYESNSIIQIKQENNMSKLLELDKLQEMQDISGEIELLRSKVILRKVISKLPLQITYYNQGTVLQYELYRSSPYQVELVSLDSNFINIPVFIEFLNEKQYTIDFVYAGKEINLKGETGKNLVSDYFNIIVTVSDFKSISQQQNAVKQNAQFFKFNSIENLTNQYVKNLDVKLLNSAAKTIQIVFKDYNAAKAADIVNGIAEEYISYDVERKSESAKNILAFIDEQLSFVYDRLKDSETSIQSFKTENKLTSDKDIITTNIERLSIIENEIMNVELEERVIQEIEKSIRKSEKEMDVYNIIPLLTGTKFEDNLSSMVKQLQELLMQKETFYFDATKSSPQVKALDYKIDIQKKLLLESLSNLSTAVSNKKKGLIQKAQSIESTFANAPSKEVEFARLLRHFSINEKFYTLLMEKRTEFSILKASFVPQNVILEKGTSSYSPVSPQKKLIYAAALFTAILIGLLLIIIRYLMHNTISSLNEIVKHTHATVSILGIVPKYKNDIPVSQLVVNKNPKSIIAESFRTVRTNMQFISNTPGAKLVAITSTISGEGKTFVAINIAGIIAYSGKKVIILDLDMRKPKIHLGFGVQNIKGMSTILIEKDTIENCIQHSVMDNLDFITAGPIPPNPSELIISEKMDMLLEHLKKIYDVVIVDNPPVGLVTDGISIVQKADYPIYIFRADYSKKNFIHNLDRLINENKVKHLSVVLNGVDIDRSAYGYNYGYGYGYGYGYTSDYYNDLEKSKKKTLKQRIFGE
jgi:capsular exopolysaccharide synthesis family protein